MSGASLFEQVRAQLNALAPDAARVVVGVSGGSDSVALALALAGDARLAGLAHIDHGLRDADERAADEALVGALAGRLGVPLLVQRVDVAAALRDRGGNRAELARRLRYTAFANLAKRAGADAIAVAHTRDDQAETVVLQLLRGAATLHGMPARRGRVVRPCLAVSRAALRAALRDADQPWRDDPSNDDPSSTRARVRHEILPQLEVLAPGLSARVARLAEVQHDLRSFLADATTERLRGLPAEVDAATLQAQPPAVQRAAFAALLSAAGVAVDEGRIEGARRELARRSGAWRLQMGEGVYLRSAAGDVAVVRDVPAPPTVEVRVASQLPSGIDATVLADGPLLLRGRAPGDVIRLPGGRRLVADLLIDACVPRERRDSLRVLARGSEVLWVEGLACAVGASARPGRVVDPDEVWMRRALELAQRAAAEGELPVGALVVVDGRVVGEGWNRSVALHDATAHAEMQALQAASRSLGRRQLSDATLVVTLEPCVMCYGAVLQAHVGRVVYGARNRRDGALGGVRDLWGMGWKRRPEVRGGVLARACGALLTAFFDGRRREGTGV